MEDVTGDYGTGGGGQKEGKAERLKKHKVISPSLLFF
jgi:hypothetical protein